MFKIIMKKQIDEKTSDLINIIVYDVLTEKKYKNISIIYKFEILQNNGSTVKNTYYRKKDSINWLEFWLKCFENEGYYYIKKPLLY